MPIRIYALAKELGIENKQLVDICDRAGIKGKGSALASLTEEEVAKVQSFIKDTQNGSAKPEIAASAHGSTKEAPLPEVVRHDVIPKKEAAEIRNLDARPKKRPVEKEGQEAPKRTVQKKKAALNVKLAAMPEVVQPTVEAKKDEPKVHKPDISLPLDAMRAKVAAAGSAPLQQFTETSKTKQKKKGRDAVKRDVAITPDAKDLEEHRGKGRRGGKADVIETGLGSTRQTRTARVKPTRSLEGEERFTRRQPIRRRKSTGVNTAAPRKENVVLELPCSVRSFSEATGVPAGQMLKALMELGIMANINAELDDEVAHLLIEKFGLEVQLKQSASLEETLIDSIEQHVDDEADLVPRPPIVTFLGHVDHGKTSLLDAIIGINVVSGEAGGITQHIRAYSIEKNGKQISFVDTPGHEAFTEMRARGANVTDIAVLVVAADDGVMPQTEEAISHAKAAGVPIIVALNKIDLPSANPDKALQDLASRELLPSEWGGEVEVVRTSATVGTGLDELLETILLTAELYEYKANPKRQAFGTCLEARQEPGRGVIAKVIVQNGTLKTGDVVVCGSAYGRVKAMFDLLIPNKSVERAGPSIPVDVTGLDVAPEAGDRLYVLNDIVEARELAVQRLHRSREQDLAGITTRISLDDFQQRLATGSLADSREELIKLNLIIRADVRGSIEAIQKELSKLDHPEVQINILQASVGGITVGDVTLASASGAVIIGFNVVPDDAARSLADERNVEIRRYDIIYKITDDIKATLEGRLKPEEKTVDTGSAMVLRTFTISRSGTIAGCRVMRGTIERDCRIRLIRDSRVIGDYALESLRREKDDAKEVRQGMECGIKLAGFNDIKEADTLEAYKIEEVARTL